MFGNLNHLGTSQHLEVGTSQHVHFEQKAWAVKVLWPWDKDKLGHPFNTKNNPGAVSFSAHLSSSHRSSSLQHSVARAHTLPPPLPPQIAK
jgi:hypothetical protein